MKSYDYILASKSPRRQMLLKEIVPNFEIQFCDVEEHYPDTLKGAQIVEYLANLKASAFDGKLADKQLLITADTIVWIDNQVLGKPKDHADAVRMLSLLSGQKHTVFTGVCLKTNFKQHVFSSSTDVYFRQLTNQEIEYYIDTYKPFDKAGSYGIQEWIGYIGIERIDGSYFNVMGLPVQKLYTELQKFCVD